MDKNSKIFQKWVKDNIEDDISRFDLELYRNCFYTGIKLGLETAIKIKEKK